MNEGKPKNAITAKKFGAGDLAFEK